MQKIDIKYENYIKILEEELIPAMGCTEPISIAYGAAKAREILGEMPDEVCIEVSSNIMKNVKSVVVPNTNNLRGVPAAVAAGIVAGKSDKALEVIAEITDDERDAIMKYIKTADIRVLNMDTQNIFDILITVKKGDSYAKVRIAHYHTNIIWIEKNGQVLFQAEDINSENEGLADRSLLNVADIYDFAVTVCIEDIHETIQRQIEYNSAIAEEGLKNNYGSSIGKTLLSVYGNDVKNRAKAFAAAGSDARMNGCELPVVINSGSGNQGITASLPVIEYAKELYASEEKLYRALVLSNLITIYQKSKIGRLSAYCGVISAGAGAGTGIAYLYGGDYQDIVHTLVNALAIVSGIICDGAKASCAAKIAAAVDAGIFGYHMYKEGHQFYGGDGIVSKGVEATLTNVGYLGKDGMSQTDKEIIRIMLEK